MAEWPENYVHSNGLGIHYYRTESLDKPPLLLLHGVMDNGLCWTPVARVLQADFTVFMLDARGHGQTGGSLDDFSYTCLAADVAGFIRALDLQKPCLFGHSMGAMTAAVVAADYPDLVRTLVLEDPPLRDELPAEGAGAEPTQDMLQMMQGILALRTLSPEERLTAARIYNPVWDEVELAPWAESKVEFNPAVLTRLEMAYPWRTTFPLISCPVLLVTGDPAAHAIVTPQVAQEAVSLWQNGEVVQIQDAGHCIHRDRFAETMTQIQSFLNEM